MITRSAPFIQVHRLHADRDLAVDFVAYFKLNEPRGADRPQATAHISIAPGPFTPGDLGDRALYRVIRVSFSEPKLHRVCPAVSDHEVISEEEFDWSAIDSSMKHGESVEHNVQRTQSLWLQSGVCPDPCFYEVQGSQWLSQAALGDQTSLHHYLLLGQDEYVEVIAEDWRWEPGQPAT
jgi:hypothetical protein